MATRTLPLLLLLGIDALLLYVLINDQSQTYVCLLSAIAESLDSYAKIAIFATIA